MDDSSRTDVLISNLLTLEVEENKDSISIKWFGKSIDREPGKFITPVLANVLNKSSGRNKRITLDFRELVYMNSSTITPVIKVLDRAKRGTVQLDVLYDKSKKWQDLNFSALKIFETADRRVAIKGL